MNTSALVTFLIIASFIWGGVTLIVSTAFRREGAKQRRAAETVRGTRRPPES